MGDYSFLLAIAVVFMFGTMSPGPKMLKQLKKTMRTAV